MAFYLLGSDHAGTGMRSRGRPLEYPQKLDLGEHEVGETVTAQNATVLLQAKDQGEAMAIPIQVTLLR